MINKSVLRACLFGLANILLVLIWLRVFKSPFPFLGWACIILHVIALVSVKWSKVFNK